MYPTLVVTLVARETSVLEECASRAGASGVLTLPSMQFAAPNTSSDDRGSLVVSGYHSKGRGDPRADTTSPSLEAVHSMIAELQEA
jgi:hypothetical protein